MVDKLFGKYASWVSLVIIFILGGLGATHVITPATADMLMIAMGIHLAASDSAVKPAK